MSDISPSDATPRELASRFAAAYGLNASQRDQLLRIVEMAESRVSEQTPASSSAPPEECMAFWRFGVGGLGWHCTRPKGHEGEHVATANCDGTGEVHHRWLDKEPPPIGELTRTIREQQSAPLPDSYIVRCPSCEKRSFVSVQQHPEAFANPGPGVFCWFCATRLDLSQIALSRRLHEKLAVAPTPPRPAQSEERRDA